MTEALQALQQLIREAPRVWIESTDRANKEPGSEWDLGRCLWSPTRYEDGKDRYSFMRLPAAGHAVLHFVTDHWPDGSHEKRVQGFSEVIGSAIETAEEPPRAGRWAGRRSYYRIPLNNYLPLQPALSLRTLEDVYANEILAEIAEDAPRYFPFIRYRQTVRLAQGAYLSEATPKLVSLIMAALGIEDAETAEHEPSNPNHEDFAEGQRRRRETYFFSRNPRLARAAKEAYGYRCMVCEFDFAARYGELGARFIECHHLDPLSERAEGEWTAEMVTQLDRVAVLCSNFHRMVHRKRPPLTLDELRSHVASHCL